MRISYVNPEKQPSWCAKWCKFDTHCVICARSTGCSHDLCQHCKALLKPRSFVCRQNMTHTLCLGCGDEIPVSQGECADESAAQGLASLSSTYPSKVLSSDVAVDRCQACASANQRLLARIVAPYRYSFPFDHLVKRLKYSNQRQLARLFGELLAEAVLMHGQHERPSILLPMPLHPVRLRQRGFNQARDIAYWSGKALNIPLGTSMVSRIVDTGSLAGLARQERQHRILGAFRADCRLNGQHVAIVDDVLTSGASSRELARELYDSGAASVELWVLARTSSVREPG